jgi:hypothetical protein
LYKEKAMHRLLLVKTPQGEEKVLAECKFEDNPAGAGKILEVKYPGDEDFAIHHFMMDRCEMVMYSSAHATQGIRFLTGHWNAKWNFVRCDVVHGQDLLEAVYKEVKKIARKN